MKQLTITITLIFLTVISYSQTKKDSIPKQDTIAVFNYAEILQVLQWVDATNEPNQSVKKLEQFIYKHIQIIPQPADKPKKK